MPSFEAIDSFITQRLVQPLLEWTGLKPLPTAQFLLAGAMVEAIGQASLLWPPGMRLFAMIQVMAMLYLYGMLPRLKSASRTPLGLSLRLVTLMSSAVAIAGGKLADNALIDAGMIQIVLGVLLLAGRDPQPRRRRAPVLGRAWSAAGRG